MNDETIIEEVLVLPTAETLRGYVEELDKSMNCEGTILVWFLAAAQASGADVDAPLIREKFEPILREVASRYNMQVVQERVM